MASFCTFPECVCMRAYKRQFGAASLTYQAHAIFLILRPSVGPVLNTQDA